MKSSAAKEQSKGEKAGKEQQIGNDREAKKETGERTQSPDLDARPSHELGNQHPPTEARTIRSLPRRNGGSAHRPLGTPKDGSKDRSQAGGGSITPADGTPLDCTSTTSSSGRAASDNTDQTPHAGPSIQSGVPSRAELRVQLEADYQAKLAALPKSPLSGILSYEPTITELASMGPIPERKRHGEGEEEWLDWRMSKKPRRIPRFKTRREKIPEWTNKD